MKMSLLQLSLWLLLLLFGVVVVIDAVVVVAAVVATLVGVVWLFRVLA